MKKWGFTLFFLLVTAFLCPKTWAEFYRYTDENGVVRFTDNLAEVPEDQIDAAKGYRESVSTTNQPATGSRPSDTDQQTNRGENSDTMEQLLKQQATLNQQYLELEKERKQLEAEKAQLKTNEQRRAFNEKVRDYTKRVMMFEAQQKNLKAAFDQAVKQNRSRTNETPAASTE